MASLQAFGQTGPRRDYVSFGPILMSYSGMAYLWRDPEIERPGAACQTAFPDYIAPSYGALAIMAALHYRARTGRGQYIDISQAETAASMIGPAYLDYLINGREPRPQGNFSATCGAPRLLSVQRRRPLVRDRHPNAGRVDSAFASSPAIASG